MAFIPSLSSKIHANLARMASVPSKVSCLPNEYMCLVPPLKPNFSTLYTCAIPHEIICSLTQGPCLLHPPVLSTQ